MSNNRNTHNNNNRVSGPTSALSSFLREHGISVPNISRRARREQRERLERQNTSEEATPESQLSTSEATHDTEMAESSTAASTRSNSTTAAQNATSSMLYNPSKKAQKRTRKREKDSDDDSDDDDDNENNYAGPSSSSRRAAQGRARIIFCTNCKGRFARKNGDDMSITICPDCQAGPSSSASKKPTRKKKVIPNIKKQQILNTEVLPSLQDCCIAVIAEYIDEVENFGDIADDSLEKLAKIISRNRKINDMTSKLFMQPFRKQLSLFDCTNMSDHAFYMISQFCPRLEYLQLIYCGQITDKSLKAYQERLLNLKSLELSGPFLITKEAWISFFESVGSRLESFEVRHSARFVKECMEALATHCPNLKKLKFGHLSHLDSDWLLYIAQLRKLETLELAWTSNENSLATEDVIHLLSKVGSGLKDLSIKGGHELTDDILSQGILKYCNQVKKLNLEQCDQLTAPAMVAFLNQWETKGLTHLDISRCSKFDDTVLEAVLRHSGSTLQYLNLHSLTELGAASGLELIAGNGADISPCSSLTHLDCGFVRTMDDFVLQKLIQHCASLQNIQVWGCHMLTENVRSKPGLRIFGREMSVQYM